MYHILKPYVEYMKSIVMKWYMEIPAFILTLQAHHRKVYLINELVVCINATKLKEVVIFPDILSLNVI